MNIDFTVYNLVYYRKNDGLKFYVRRICGQDYRLINSETFEKHSMSQHYLRKDYLSDKETAKAARYNQIKIA